MATSERMNGNTISISGRSGQRFFIDWQLAGQSIANNTSTINWQAKFHYDIADAQLDNGTASLSGTRWSNGGRIRNYGADFRTRDVTLSSGSFTIGHNADGTRSLSVSGGVDVYGSGRSSGSQSFSLPTIPRNSQVTTNNSGSWSLGTPITIYTNRKSSSFTHTITIRLGGSGGTVLQTINSVGESTVWTPTSAQITTIQNSIPNANLALIHITQRNNQVGQNSTTQAWTYLRDANPEFTNFTYKDNNSAVATITGNDQVLVKGKSTLQVTVPSANKMTAIKGATADYYAVAYDGVSNNVSYSTSNVNTSFSNIDTVGSRAILVTAYDSRTNNTRVAKNVQVYDYKAPNIELEVTRENNWGDNVTVSTGGTFDLLPIGGVNKNSLTANSLKYRYREKGASTWGSWTTIAFTVSGDGFAGTNQFITLDNTKEYQFEFQIADKFGTITQTAELGKGTPLQFVGRKSDGTGIVGINKMPEDGALDVAGDIYSNGKKVSGGWWEELARSSGSTINLTTDQRRNNIKIIVTESSSSNAYYGIRINGISSGYTNRVTTLTSTSSYSDSTNSTITITGNTSTIASSSSFQAEVNFFYSGGTNVNYSYNTSATTRAITGYGYIGSAGIITSIAPSVSLNDGQIIVLGHD